MNITHSRRMLRAAVLVAAGLVAGCSASGPASTSGTGGDSASAGSGGSSTPGSGGATQPGGSGGATATGGSGTGTGGMLGTGGGSGGAVSGTGGAVATGGASTGGSAGGSPGETGGSAGGASASGGQAGGHGGGTSSAGGVGGSGNAGSKGTGGSAAGGASGGSLKAFIVITSKGTPTPGDMLMIGRLTAHGFSTVTPVTDAAVTAESVVGADLVVISSSAESAPLKAKLKDIAIPTFVIEDAEFSMMGMASSGNHDSGVSQVVIASAGSPLVGTETGTVTIASKPGDLGWGTPAATALVGATMPGNPAHAAIFGYEKGAQMSGMAAPAKRAGFAIREALAAGLNADGIKLFDAILEWLML